MALSISQVSFERHRTALGIGESTPRISWRFDGKVSDWFQSAYDVEIKRQGQAERFSFNSSDSVLVPWPGDALGSGEEASVRVRSFGRRHQPDTPWSEPVRVEAGLLKTEDWQGAAAIVSDRPTEVNTTHRPIYFRKDFDIHEEVLSARLYITALGLYEASLNGRRVGDLVLAPGWQSYTHRHEYNTYDVTDLLRDGQNTIGVVVGEGWYSGTLGWNSNRNIYGDSLGVLCLLSVTTADGTAMYFPSDETWKYNIGPIVTFEIYNGERYDSRLELKGWDKPGFNTTGWLGVHEVEFSKDVLAAPDGPPVRRVGEQLVGWLRVRVKGPRGQTIKFIHTEVMENGEVATRPLRTAKATDYLTLSGEFQEWEPTFTFHGFRYVQVDNWPAGTELNADSVTAIVVHSDMEEIGSFKSSNSLLNKLHSNILWSMRGNFLSIATDCPQRDERLGWTGDIHAFARTANFLYNTAGFLRGWLKDAHSEELENNYAPPHVIPNVLGPTSAISIWGDSIVAVPWALFQSYGDTAMLEEQYAAPKDWIDRGIPRNEARLWNRSTFQFADWLDPKAPPENPGAATTHPHLVSDEYLIRSTELLANISKYLAKNDEAEQYARDREELSQAFREAWISESGSVANETQTGLTLPLYFGLFAEEEHYEAAVGRLVELIQENEFKVGTGFAGTHLLGHTLSQYGQADTFYKMLLQEEVPGWMFQVVMNGTTTWERWDSMLANGSVNPGEMTSFNHYAVGSVGAWMYENIGGLRPVEPGWRRFSVDVKPGGGLRDAETRVVTPYGVAGTEWWVSGGRETDCEAFHLVVQVPPNTRATVILRESRKSKTQKSVVVGSGVHRYDVDCLP